MNNKVLVLCSGGPDGAVAAALMLESTAVPMDVTLLHFDYEQRALSRELLAVTALARHWEINVIYRSIRGAFGTKSGLVVDGPDYAPKDLQGPAAFLPARNLVFLSIAANIAAEMGIAYLAHGNIKTGIYVDNKRLFTERFDSVLQTAVDVPMRCIGPVNHMTKSEVITKGIEMQVPLGLTWSCYLAGPKHCGQCASCLGRKQAYAELGVIDDVEYER